MTTNWIASRLKSPNKSSNLTREDLTEIAIKYRTAKKICRKCHSILPPDTNKCRKCHNTDLRKRNNMSKGGMHYSLNYAINLNINKIRKKINQTK